MRRKSGPIIQYQHNIAAIYETFRSLCKVCMVSLLRNKRRTTASLHRKWQKEEGDTGQHLP